MESKTKNVDEVEVGKVTHYYTSIGVAVVVITQGDIKVGDKIHINGHTSNFKQKVDSMQLEHKKITKAVKGQSVGLKVEEHVRQHDKVYKVAE